MSQIVVICPHCNKRLGINPAPAAGTALTCPKCNQQFAAPSSGPAPAQAAPPRMVPPKPPKIQQPAAPDPQPDLVPIQQPGFAPFPRPAYVQPPSHPQYYSPPGYPQKYVPSQETGNSKGLIIGLSAAAGGIALLIVIGAIVIFSLNSKAPVAQGSGSASGQAFALPISPGSPAANGPGPQVSGTAGTPFSSSASGSNSVRQLPIVGADAALAYRWAPDKNYDYDFQLNATVDATRNSYIGSATYKLNPRTTELLARLAGADGPQEGSGTAFVVHSDGLLVTCAHVVRGSTKVSVTVGTQTYLGDVVGVDDRHDLALIRVPASNLPAVPLGDSDAVQLAEDMRAVGFPLSDVLGTSVKVTRGTIAGVVTKNGDTLLQIDASINPGNSGGPLFNDRGEVVGINSAGLVGESITNVGFAVPSNYALALLRSKGISPTAKSGGRVLAGPALARAVTPAVAFVKVDMGKAESLQILEFSGYCAKTENIIGRASANHVSDQGQLVIAPTGEILRCATEAQLPLLLMPLSTLVVEKLPSSGDREWESRRVTVLRLPSRPAESISPFGPGGMSRSGRYSRSPIGRPRQEEATMIPAVEQIKYKIASETAETLEIEKTLDISSMDPDGGTPSFQITGQGTITWDKKHGAPRLIKQTMTMSVRAGVAQASVPIDLAVELIGVTTDAERLELLRKRQSSHATSPTISTSPATASPTSTSSAGLPAVPATPRSSPARPKKSLDDHIAAIKSKEQTFSQMYVPLSELSFMEPVPERREEVAALLDPILEAKNESVRSTALNAVKKWGTQKNVPTLLKILEWKSTGDRWSAMEALGSIGGSQPAAEAVARLMLDQDDMLTAMRSLQKMGSVAEDPVWPHIGASDIQLHSNACRVLGAVGTEKSLAKLQTLIKKETDISQRVVMEIAVKDIQKRLGK